MKRAMACILSVVLLMGLCSTRGDAAGKVYFTAVNDQLLELNDETMPFWYGGALYAPSGIYAQLGVSSSYNVSVRTLTLTLGSVRMVCNLSLNMIIDSRGNSYDEEPLERGGQIFLPITLVCRVFALTVTTRTVTNGYLVRIKNGSASYDDEDYISVSGTQMNRLYEGYAAAHDISLPEKNESDGGEEEQKELYLAIIPESVGAATECMRILQTTGQRLTFLLTKDFLHASDCAACLRQMVGQGHGIALLVSDASDATELNALLRRMIQTETRLISVPNVTEQQAQRQGYTLLASDIKTDDLRLSEAGAPHRLLARAGLHSHAVLTGDAGEAALRTLLNEAKEDGVSLRAFREA